VKDVGEYGRPLTEEERKAIAALHRLAKRWPDTLTLFSWSGSLVVFKSDEWNERDMDGIDASDYVTDTIQGITNDGGDP
jgi:hypothetical protein